MAIAKGRRNGFPAAYKGLSPIDRESWLAGDECRDLVHAGQLHQTQVEAEGRRIRKSVDKLRRLVPSPNLLEEARHGWPFPPPAENTPMRRATVFLHPTEANVLWPSNYLSNVDGKSITYDWIIMRDELRRQGLGIGTYPASATSPDSHGAFGT